MMLRVVTSSNLCTFDPIHSSQRRVLPLDNSPLYSPFRYDTSIGYQIYNRWR
jgi:hypothetical protein